MTATKWKCNYRGCSGTLLVMEDLTQDGTGKKAQRLCCSKNWRHKFFILGSKSTPVNNNNRVYCARWEKPHLAYEATLASYNVQCRTAATATGRYHHDEPAMQNIPIRTEEGRRIKKAFGIGTVTGRFYPEKSNMKEVPKK